MVKLSDIYKQQNILGSAIANFREIANAPIDGYAPVYNLSLNKIEWQFVNRDLGAGAILLPLSQSLFNVANGTLVSTYTPDVGDISWKDVKLLTTAFSPDNQIQSQQLNINTANTGAVLDLGTGDTIIRGDWHFSTGHNACFILRFDSEGNCLILDLSESSIVLKLIENDVVSNIETANFTFVDSNTYTIKVQVLGVVIKVSIDDNVAISSGISNKFLQGTKFGVGAISPGAKFDLMFAYSLAGGVGNNSSNNSGIDHITGFPQLASLINYWRLEENSGIRVDSRGDLDLLDNNSVNSVAGKNQIAANFTASSNQYLNNSAFVTPSDSLTISAWIYPNGSLGMFRTIISQIDSTVDDQSFNLAIDDTEKLSFLVSNNGQVTGRVTLQSTSTIQQQTWQHVVAVFDSTAQEMQLYINAVTEGVAFQSSLFAGNQDLFVGANNNSGVPNSFFDGNIDEVAIWNVALTATEIEDLYRKQA